MIQIEKNKLYLVTGGGGFLGQPLVKHILNEGARVRIIGRDEATLVMMKQRHPSIEIHPGDISDEFEELTSVCTDLWWYSIVDLEVLKNLVPDLDESAFEIVEIPSGTWELKHEYRISEFNDNTPYATLTLLK
mgnify:CR=1 FL=1